MPAGLVRRNSAYTKRREGASALPKPSRNVQARRVNFALPARRGGKCFGVRCVLASLSLALPHFTTQCLYLQHCQGFMYVVECYVICDVGVTDPRSDDKANFSGFKFLVEL